MFGLNTVLCSLQHAWYFKMSSDRICFTCTGRGQNQKTRQVLNVGMGLALGVGLGVTYIPQYRTEFYYETCYRCSGTGKERY